MPKPDAGPGSCNATNCPDGCCSGSACINRTTNSQCGKGGNTCTSCGSTQTCESGTCTPCSGCVDLNTGLCTSGTTNTSCGKSGNYCQTCNTSSGQACTNNVCQGGGCNASTCPTGCCDGLTCIRPADYTNFKCGSGTTGGACVSCNGRCDKIQGVCVSTSTDGGGGGTIDGGFPSPTTCSPTDASVCAVGECCQNVLGSYTCLTSGTDLIFYKVCGSKTQCEHCMSPTMCNAQTYTCQ